MAQQSLSAFERRLLNRIQESLPVTSRPFLAVAKDLGTSEEQVLEGLAQLKRKRILRRVGGVFSSRDLGFVTTLVTAKVARCTLGRVVKVVSSFPEVTHNYQRDNEYNLWFTLTAVSRRRVREVIASVKREPGVQSIVELPAVKYYKVEVKFSL